MERDKMSRESRDELLERILEETARKPYRPSPSSKPAASASQAARKKAATVSHEAAPSVSQNVPQESREARPQANHEAKPKAKNEEATQVFSNAEINSMVHEKTFEKPQEKPDEAEIERMQMQSAADKIQRIKQEKAAAAKAAVMRKAELDNSIMMQKNGNFEAPEMPTFSADGDEKVNVILPEDEYLSDYSEEYDEREAAPVSTKILNIVNYVLCAAVMLLVLFNYIFSFVGVNGDSMKPILSNGNMIFTLNVGYTPARGDVVTINNKTAALLDENGNVTEKAALDCMITKRIVAVGGDTIDFDFENGTVTVNGEVLEEKYISEPTTRDEGAFQYPLTIPEGYVFVLGDNRNISKDSRHEDIGLVPADEIAGKVIFKIYPFGDFGGID